jgi:hypothetical protein
LPALRSEWRHGLLILFIFLFYQRVFFEILAAILVLLSDSAAVFFLFLFKHIYNGSHAEQSFREVLNRNRFFDRSKPVLRSVETGLATCRNRSFDRFPFARCFIAR